jgi:hypothetical protein
MGTRYKWVILFMFIFLRDLGVVHAGQVKLEDLDVKTRNTKKLLARKIRLQSPPHSSTLTPGKIAFSWQATTNAKSKPEFELTLENLNTKKKRVVTTREKLRRIYCESGRYRWRVSNKNHKSESRWRLFKVIEFKSHGI